MHFYDGYLKQVNKQEFDRYERGTREGVNSLFKVKFSENTDTGLIDITSFETGTDENKRLTYMHDLHTGTRPFVGRGNRGSKMHFFL